VLPYLENGNVLAARTFIIHFVQRITVAHPTLTADVQPNPIPLADIDEITLTTDSMLNFAQLAVRVCQRAQGDKNKVMRECWIRLCVTYQSLGGPLAQNEIRRALGQIAELYFAIVLPRGQAANPLGDMFSALMGGPPGGGAQAPQRRRLPPPAANPTTAGLD